MSEYRFEIIQNLRAISNTEWNGLLTDNNPFLKYEFVSALENNQCLGETVGWHPNHCIARNNKNELIAAIPSYIKTNSFGEFVFDWSWASAYERSGLNYYPKLVSAIPFTPVTGQRILIRSDYHDSDIKISLQQHLLDFAKENNFSSLHWLFPTAAEVDFLETQGYLKRLAYQYHWTNHQYQSMEEYLATFKSRKRKKVNREREHVKEAGVQIIIKKGNELTESEWNEACQFYQSTFYKKNNYPSLTENFFQTVSQTMGDQIVVIFAQYQQKNVAAAINFKSDTTLYGRYWGCTEEFNSLHFEVCFYQGIEYCITNGLQRFEPGAQGEHKISRGFLATEVWSAHWIAHESFRNAIRQFLDRETKAMQKYKLDLDALSPFRNNADVND